MADSFESQVKKTSKDVKHFFGKGFRIVARYSKQGWAKLKNLRN